MLTTKPEVEWSWFGVQQFSLHLENQDTETKFGTWVYQRPVPISKSRSRCQYRDLKDIDVLCIFKIRIKNIILNMGVSKTSDNIQMKIKIPNPLQEPQASSKAPSQDFEDMDVLWTVKIKIEPKFGAWVYQTQWPYPNQDQNPKPQLGTYSILKIPKSGL